jgi:hypothetical protein
MRLARIGAVSLVAVSLFLVDCGSNGTTANSTTPSPTSASTPSPSPRTLMFTLKACKAACDPMGEGPSKFGQGTVQLDITNGYTITVTVTGLTPNTRHLINFHFGTCAVPNLDPPYDQIEIATADASGTLSSVTSRASAYVVPATGRILTVHGDEPTRRQTHIACVDLTS